MAALDKVIDNASANVSSGFGMVGGSLWKELAEAIRSGLHQEVWTLYAEHKDDPIRLKIPKLGIPITFRVHQIPFIHWMLTEIAGEEPAEMTQ